MEAKAKNGMITSMTMTTTTKSTNVFHFHNVQMENTEKWRSTKVDAAIRINVDVLLTQKGRERNFWSIVFYGFNLKTDVAHCLYTIKMRLIFDVKCSNILISIYLSIHLHTCLSMWCLFDFANHFHRKFRPSNPFHACSY